MRSVRASPPASINSQNPTSVGAGAASPFVTSNNKLTPATSQAIIRPLPAVITSGAGRADPDPDAMQKLARLFRNYVTRREDGVQSSAVFWYLPEPPRVYDAESLAAYYSSASPSPRYLM